MVGKQQGLARWACLALVLIVILVIVIVVLNVR